MPQELTNVSVGDTVTFEFYPPDHSVVQAEYGSACVPYSYADKDHAGKGFWTETQWVNTTADVSTSAHSILIPPDLTIRSSFMISLVSHHHLTRTYR